jgi:hypothetical protein
MEYTVENILAKLAENKYNQKLLNDEQFLAVYPYGSHIYGTADEKSDRDYILVSKGSTLKNGAFRNNAISSPDYDIQAVIYSRSGFQDAINNYEIGALECLSLKPEQALMSKWPFKIQKWSNQDMIKKIITKASDSWHLASLQVKDDDCFTYLPRKGVFHALRILSFGLQLKAEQRIYDFSECNDIKSLIDEDDFSQKIIPKQWFNMRNDLMDKLKND